MTKRGFWGLALVLAGAALLWQEFGGVSLGLSFWPVVTILIGVLMIRGVRFGRRTHWFQLALGLWIASIGLFSILHNAHITHITGGNVASKGWPILLIAIGLSALFSRRKHGAWHFEMGDFSKMRMVGDVRYDGPHWVLNEDLTLDHGIGDVKLDLTSADIPDGTHRVDVDVKIGEVLIRVPDNVNVVAAGRVYVGELQVLDDRQGGIGELSAQRQVMVPDATVTLEIQAQLRIGKLKISREPARGTRIGS